MAARSGARSPHTVPRSNPSEVASAAGIPNSFSAAGFHAWIPPLDITSTGSAMIQNNSPMTPRFT